MPKDSLSPSLAQVKTVEAKVKKLEAQISRKDTGVPATKPLATPLAQGPHAVTRLSPGQCFAAASRRAAARAWAWDESGEGRKATNKRRRHDDREQNGESDDEEDGISDEAGQIHDVENDSEWTVDVERSNVTDEDAPEGLVRGEETESEVGCRPCPLCDEASKTGRLTEMMCFASQPPLPIKQKTPPPHVHAPKQQTITQR